MGRSLKDIKASAQAEKPPVDEIEPYVIGLSSGEEVPLRDPDLITQAEEEDAPGSLSGFKRQLYLMCPDAESFRRVWNELRYFDGYELKMVGDDIGDWFNNQKSGKSRRPSRSSTGTSTPSRPTSASSLAST